jgi:hypothetical protein
MRVPRTIARLLLVLAAFTVAAFPCYRLELLCQRELYHALESAGIITHGTNLWGQILGRNIPLHPHWMRILVRSIGTVGVLPAMAAALVLTPRLGRAWRLAPPGKRWKWGLSALALTWCIYAAASAIVEPYAWNWAANAALSLGKFLGCQYAQLGRMVMGPDGPFISGARAPLCNAIWRTAPRLAASAAAFLPAMIVFHQLVRRRAALPAGCCLNCGYDLAGLPSAACPECGTLAPDQ